MLLLILIFLVLLICFTLATLASLSVEKTTAEREKTTPFECGFSPAKKARSAFSMRFFSTTLIFLIFDIELAILMPLGVLSTTANNLFMITLAFSIIIILTAGLVHEWKEGALNWVI